MERRRVVLVTGAASGIGAAVCRALAAPGVALLVHTRKNRDGAARVAAEAEAAGAKADVALGDLADATVAERLGRMRSRGSAGWTCWSAMPDSPIARRSPT